MTVRMRAKDEITVNGTTYQSGDEFDIDDAAAAHVPAKYAERLETKEGDAPREAAPVKTKRAGRRGKK